MVYEKGVPMKILVTGATGNIGRLVVDELLALGATDVRALTVDPAKAALPPSVEVARGYLGDPRTLPAAFAGVDRMYLAPLLTTVREATRLAAEAGVRHIVDLAGAPGSSWPPIERAVEDCGVPWTHLEAGEFMTNAAIWAPQIRAGDVVRDAYPEEANPMIAPADIAAVAARVLLDGVGHQGRAYTLTGPQSLTRRERITRIGQALGRSLTVETTGPDQAVADLAPVMGAHAEWYLSGIAASAAAGPRPPTTTVADVTGREGTTFLRWAEGNAALFR
jgi:uncharacterized protein YbjT (DUF2867 family)